MLIYPIEHDLIWHRWRRRLSDTLIAAICTVIAIAVLAPLANHFITKYRERRSLRASLWVHDSPPPEFLKTQLTEQFYKPGGQRLFELASVRGYMKLTLHNPSKKKINAVTVTLLSLSGLLYQIENQPELHGPDERKVLLGDLQPHQSCTLHIWTSVSYEGWYYASLPGFFEITADEIDKRTLKFPFPGYLKSLVSRRVNHYCMWGTIVFAAVSLVSVLYMALWKHV